MKSIKRIQGLNEQWSRKPQGFFKAWDSIILYINKSYDKKYQVTYEKQKHTRTKIKMWTQISPEIFFNLNGTRLYGSAIFFFLNNVLESLPCQICFIFLTATQYSIIWLYLWITWAFPYWYLSYFYLSCISIFLNICRYFFKLCIIKSGILKSKVILILILIDTTKFAFKSIFIYHLLVFRAQLHFYIHNKFKW